MYQKYEINAKIKHKVKHTNEIYKHVNNLLKNSAAVRNMDKWSVSDWSDTSSEKITESTDTARMGQKCFKVSQNTSNLTWPVATQKVSISKSNHDRKYTLSADVRVNGTLLGGSGTSLHLAAFDGTNQLSGDEHSEWIFDTGAVSNTPKKECWRRIRVTINVLAGATTIQ